MPTQNHKEQLAELMRKFDNSIQKCTGHLRQNEHLITAGGYKVWASFVNEERPSADLKVGDWLHTWEDFHNNDGIQIRIRKGKSVVRWTRRNNTYYDYPQMSARSDGFKTLQRAVEDLQKTDPELQGLLTEFVQLMDKLLADPASPKITPNGYTLSIVKQTKDEMDDHSPSSGEKIPLQTGDSFYSLFHSSKPEDGIRVLVRDYHYYRVHLTMAKTGLWTSYPKMRHDSRGYQTLQTAVAELQALAAAQSTP